MLWLFAEATPGAPIGDPYLAVMEVLTIFSALALLCFVIAIWCFAEAHCRLRALAMLISGSLGAGLTMTVHFVQLTAVRQLWRTGQIPDYKLVWPSPLFAAEYFAWDVLIGITMVLAGSSLSGGEVAVPARRALVFGGILCLFGAAGPLQGWMALQNVSLFGYAFILPIASALSARMFYSSRGNPPPEINDSMGPKRYQE